MQLLHPFERAPTNLNDLTDDMLRILAASRVEVDGVVVQGGSVSHLHDYLQMVPGNGRRWQMSLNRVAELADEIGFTVREGRSMTGAGRRGGVCRVVTL